MSSTQEKPVKNTDVELWREPTNEPGMSYYMPSVHVTQAGKIGINVGGSVYVKSLTEWHELAGGSLVQSPNPSDQITQEKLQRAMMTGPNRWAEKTINGKLVSYFEIHDETILLDLIDSAKREAYKQGYIDAGIKEITEGASKDLFQELLLYKAAYGELPLEQSEESK